MATRRYSVGVSEHTEDIVEAAGAAVVTKSIELTVDIGNAVLATSQGRSAVVQALARLEDYIMKSNWPPV